MISSGSRSRSKLRVSAGRTPVREGRGGPRRLEPDVQDDGIGSFGWRARYQHMACLVIIAQLQGRLQRNENAVLDLFLKKFPDNGILGGKRFLDRPVILVHLAGCNVRGRANGDPRARYGTMCRPAAEPIMR